MTSVIGLIEEPRCHQPLDEDHPDRDTSRQTIASFHQQQAYRGWTDIAISFYHTVVYMTPSRHRWMTFDAGDGFHIAPMTPMVAISRSRSLINSSRENWKATGMKG